MKIPCWSGKRTSEKKHSCVSQHFLNNLLFYIEEWIRFSKIQVTLQCINTLSITWLSTTKMAHACTRTHTHRWYGMLWHLMKYIRVTYVSLQWHSGFLLYRCALSWIFFWKANCDIGHFCLLFKMLKSIWIPIWFTLAFLNICTQIHFCPVSRQHFYDKITSGFLVI